MSLEIIQTVISRKLGCGFLFAFHSNWLYLPSLPRQSEIFVENHNFFQTPCIRPSVCHPVWYKEKLEWWGYPMVKNWGYIQRCRQNTGVWQTDMQTDVLRRHSPRYAYASRGKMMWKSVAAIIRKMQLISFVFESWQFLTVFSFLLLWSAANSTH